VSEIGLARRASEPDRLITLHGAGFNDVTTQDQGRLFHEGSIMAVEESGIRIMSDSLMPFSQRSMNHRTFAFFKVEASTW